MKSEKGREAVIDVAKKWEDAYNRGEINSARWNKIKGWIKTAKDGRLPGFYFGICFSTVDCHCAYYPEECAKELEDFSSEQSSCPSQ